MHIICDVIWENPSHVAKGSGVTAGGQGAQCPPDAAQRENQPTDQEKRGVVKKRKRRGMGKKGRKGKK